MEKHMPLPVDGRHFDRWLADCEIALAETAVG
jgi:hypothetical protein